MEPTLVTETSEVKTQTPGKFPEESTLVSISYFVASSWLFTNFWLRSMSQCSLTHKKSANKDGVKFYVYKEGNYLSLY
jgi:hypothetical protein